MYCGLFIKFVLFITFIELVKIYKIEYTKYCSGHSKRGESKNLKINQLISTGYIKYAPRINGPSKKGGMYVS
jgi:hypothetical protein